MWTANANYRSTDLDDYVKKFFGIISYAILDKMLSISGLKKIAEYIGHEIKKGVELIGHEIKENTELAEHETGINNVICAVYSVKKILVRQIK